ncbi:hypothetical protein J3R83DRAFT_1167 [Lanmaoa asiatica]|nr:hypothetical protein J3R83DRAFT_1167 [Lanmaoa asiatica]
MMVRAANSLTASKNAKLDHQLPFSEFLFARNHFLMAIQNAKWGDPTVDAFNWFFHNIENHTIQYALIGTTNSRQCKAYNIGTIKDELIDRIARELDSKDVRSNLEQVRTWSPETYPNADITDPPHRLTSTCDHYIAPAIPQPAQTHFTLPCCCCHMAFLAAAQPASPTLAATAYPMTPPPPSFAATVYPTPPPPPLLSAATM